MRGNGTARATCERCGEIFACPPSYIRKGIRFCSMACRTTKHVFVCKQCGAPFERRDSEVRRGETIFCAPACVHASKVGVTLPVAPRLMSRSSVGNLPERHPEYGPCRLWDGALTENGYGNLDVKGKSTGAHRAAWMVANGEMPSSDLVVAHTCDVKRCIQTEGQGTHTVRGIAYPRWGHLFLCPSEVNQYDKVEKGRQARGKSSGRHTMPDAFAIGSRQWSAKLTEQLATQIRAEYAAGGVRQVDLAAKYGMKQPAISSLLRRETWKHVP